MPFKVDHRRSLCPRFLPSGAKGHGEVTSLVNVKELAIQEAFSASFVELKKHMMFSTISSISTMADKKVKAFVVLLASL